MAICIRITKCREVDGIHVYQVRKIDFEDPYEFYVVLSAGKKIISFYSDQELKNLLKATNFDDPNETIGVPGIPAMIVGCVLRKCLEAIDNNYFPESMGYYA